MGWIDRGDGVLFSGVFVTHFWDGPGERGGWNLELGRWRLEGWVVVVEGLWRRALCMYGGRGGWIDT